VETARLDELLNDGAPKNVGRDPPPPLEQISLRGLHGPPVPHEQVA